MCSVFCSQHGLFTCFHSSLLGDDWSSKYLAPIRQRQWLKVSLQFGVWAPTWALWMDRCSGELKPWRLSVPKIFCPFSPAAPCSVQLVPLQIKGLNQTRQFWPQKCRIFWEAVVTNLSERLKRRRDHWEEFGYSSKIPPPLYYPTFYQSNIG